MHQLYVVFFLYYVRYCVEYFFILHTYMHFSMFQENFHIFWHLPSLIIILGIYQKISIKHQWYLDYCALIHKIYHLYFYFYLGQISIRIISHYMIYVFTVTFGTRVCLSLVFVQFIKIFGLVCRCIDLFIFVGRDYFYIEIVFIEHGPQYPKNWLSQCIKFFSFFWLSLDIIFFKDATWINFFTNRYFLTFMSIFLRIIRKMLIDPSIHTANSTCHFITSPYTFYFVHIFFFLGELYYIIDNLF